MMPFLEAVWQINLWLSALLALILVTRWILRKTAGIYNSYWLWLALPLTPICAYLLAQSGAFAELFSAINPTPPLPELTALGTHTAFFELEPHQPLQQFEPAPSSPLPWLGYAWLLGSLLFTARLLQQHYVLRTLLRTAPYNIDIELKSRYRLTGVDKPDFSPAVYGFFKPQIYFPIALLNHLDKQQRELIIKHEEQHIRHGHLWLNLVWDLVVCLFWFNPIVYVARQSYRHDQEVLCDYLVLKNSDVSSQKSYGNALISTVSATHSVSLLCSWKMFDQLEERIMNIKSQHLLSKQGLMASALLTVLVAGSLITAATAHEPKSEVRKKSISIVKIDTDDEKQVTIKTGGKTYRLDDGEQFILEDGERRNMTREELETFTELMTKSNAYDAAPGPEKSKIFNLDNVHSFTFDHDGRMDIDELEAKIESIMPLNAPSIGEVEIVTLFSDREDTNREIERALRRSKDSKKAAVAKARKQLEATQRKLAESQKEVERQRKLARQQAELLTELAEEKS